MTLLYTLMKGSKMKPLYLSFTMITTNVSSIALSHSLVTSCTARNLIPLTCIIRIGLLVTFTHSVLRWHHLCFTYDHQQHLISTYVDGRLNNHQNYEVDKTMSGNGAVLGQGLEAQRSFSGDLTQVNSLSYSKKEN